MEPVGVKRAYGLECRGRYCRCDAGKHRTAFEAVRGLISFFLAYFDRSEWSGVGGPPRAQSRGGLSPAQNQGRGLTPALIENR